MNHKKRNQKPAQAEQRHSHGPEPERLKITGVKKWEDAVAIAVRKKKPAHGWPKK